MNLEELKREMSVVRRDIALTRKSRFPLEGALLRSSMDPIEKEKCRQSAAFEAKKKKDIEELQEKLRRLRRQVTLLKKSEEVGHA
jgi:ribosomal protein L29